MGTPNALAFKLSAPPRRILARLTSDERIGPTEMQNARWFTFERSADSDLRDALDWLGKAYEEAGKRTNGGWSPPKK